MKITHVAFLLDRSQSTESYLHNFKDLLKSQIKTFQEEGAKNNIVHKYTFYSFTANDNFAVYCSWLTRHFFDLEVITEKYLNEVLTPIYSSGNTALLDATQEIVFDLEKIPTFTDDHAFLLNVITDGQENRSTLKPETIRALMGRLDKNPNWTVNISVPNDWCKLQAIAFGFPNSNILVYEVSSKGIKESEEVYRGSTVSYVTQRSMGTKKVTDYFKTDLSKVSKEDVRKSCREVDPKEYMYLRTKDICRIKDIVEMWTKKSYRVGSSYYELMKIETIQPYKKILLLENKTGILLEGKTRELLGLPDYEIKVKPGDHTDYTIFVLSTATAGNRNILPSTRVITFI